MSNFQKFSVLIILGFLLAGCPTTEEQEQQDESSATQESRAAQHEDEAVPPRLDEAEERRQMVEEHLERPVAENDCIEVSETFEGAFVYGAYHEGIGCVPTAMFTGELMRSDLVQGVSEMLGNHGWRSASPAERRVMARAAVVEVFFAMHDDLDTPHPAFERDDTPDFEPLQVRTGGGGGATEVTLWAEPRQSRGSQSGVARHRFVFNADASIERGVVDRFR